MKRLKLSIILVFILSVEMLLAQNTDPKDIQFQINSSTDETLLLTQEDMQWWKDAKFGLFIHWGLYSILGQGEWAMFMDRMDMDEYSRLKNDFKAQDFDASKWARIAKDAGCKYMVLTAKHHDGFCLFDSSFDDFNSINTPANKDFIKEYAEACREADLGVGIYYSPLDWRFPGYFFPNMYRASAEQMKEKTYSNIKDLMTNYGEINILWYDGGQDMWLGLGGLEFSASKGWYTRDRSVPYTGEFSWEPLTLNSMVRNNQPKVVINSRSGWMGDFATHERHINQDGTKRPWELCQTLTYSAWGWSPDAKVMELEKCIRLLSEVVCKDGNLLLNIGPDKDGNIDEESIIRLKQIGEWLKINGESIYGTTAGPFPYDPSWGGSTQSNESIYLHISDLSSNGILNLPLDNLKGLKIKKVINLDSGELIFFERKDNYLILKNIEISQEYGIKIVKITT